MKKIFATIALLGLSSFASAGFLFEGHLGYATASQLSYKFAATTYTFNSSSIPVGIKLGWKYGSGFQTNLNIDYHTSGSLTRSVGATADDIFTRTKAAFEIGYTAGTWDIFLGYNLLNNLTVTRASANANSPDAFYGTGVYFDVGYNFSPKFGMNLIYNTYTYTTFDKGATKGATIAAANYSNVTDGDVALMFSFPFTGGK